MKRVLTILCDPSASLINPSLIEGVTKVLRTADITIEDLDILAPGIAIDILIVSNTSDTNVEVLLRKHLKDTAIDIALQPRENRRKRLLIADMDSTIVTSETLDDLAAEAGIADQIAPITERAMRGELNFKEALRHRVQLLQGTSADLIERVWEKIRFTSGATTLVHTMKAYGAHTALVSGGFTTITNRVRSALGFDEDRANELLISEKRLTGKVAEPILDKNAKVSALNDLTAKLKLTPADAAAIGDGANDISLLRAVGLGAAFHAKPIVCEAAPFRIDHGDLTALLYLQGYRLTEFVS
ncbi:MAG: phosphoserine phosphatase SerB [Alphaproteobacteria bacterium]